MVRRLRATFLAVGVMVLAAAPVMAQTLTAGITGTVRDESQGVLPGVTIEAASPSLIEKVRTTVSDGEGRYNFVDPDLDPLAIETPRPSAPPSSVKRVTHPAGRRRARCERLGKSAKHTRGAQPPRESRLTSR